MKVAYTLILGEKEVIDGTVILRDMNEGVQEIMPFETVVDVVSAKLARKGSL
jgi:histidyl-tRNA synthetase